MINYFFGWLWVFVISRSIFIAGNKTEAALAGSHEMAGSFIYGIRMDISMASYLSAPVILCLIVSVFTGHRWLKKGLFIYTLILLVFVCLLMVADLPVYQAWGFRIDSTPLKYLQDPEEAAASVGNLPIILLVGFFFVMLLAFSLLFRKIISLLDGSDYGKRWIQLLWLVPVLGICFLGIRGGWQLSPINQSTVYFSSNHFANLAALNAPWNFFRTATRGDNNTENQFKFLPGERAKSLTDSLLPGHFKNHGLIKSPVSKPNIVYIIWESFTSKVINLHHEGKEVTPGFNKLSKEGIYFANAYATGDRTDKGLVTLLSAYLSQPTNSIIKSPAKAEKLPMLAKHLAALGYSTNFYYGGEPEFANIKSYLLSGGFSNISGNLDYERHELNSKWGAHDGVVARKLINEIGKLREPFFTTWLTLTSHEPFEVPVEPAFKGKDDETLFLNSMHYSDSVVYSFLRSLQKKAFWKNTVLVIAGDHGHPFPKKEGMMQRFGIPMLILGGGVSPHFVDHVVSQADITPSLLFQLNLAGNTQWPWSKDIFDPSNAWAYFSFNNGFGFVTPQSWVVWDNAGKLPVESFGGKINLPILQGQAIQQRVAEDYLKK